MQFDIGKTMQLIQGGLMDPKATWRSYLGKNPGWQETAVVLAGPLILVSVIAQVIFSRLWGSWAPQGYPGVNILLALILGLVVSVLGLAILAGAFYLLAAQFGGKKNFDRAFAAVSLAMIPAYLAAALGALIPWIGLLIAWAGLIVTLVFLYQIMPLALSVPDDKRVLHYILSLVAAIIVNAIVSLMLVASLIGTDIRADYTERDDRGDRSPVVFSEMERQADLVEAAQNDRYDPPGDGEVSEDQVEELVDVLEKTAAARQRYSERMEQLAEEMEDKEQASIGDLGKIYSGIGGAISATNAEMEVVKTGGGNWAEHQWVKNQLRIAVLQQGDGSDALAHNFALFQEYEDELSPYF